MRLVLCTFDSWLALAESSREPDRYQPKVSLAYLARELAIPIMISF
jgi:hypothetical protein